MNFPAEHARFRALLLGTVSSPVRVRRDFRILVRPTCPWAPSTGSESCISQAGGSEPMVF